MQAHQLEHKNCADWGADGVGSVCGGYSWYVKDLYIFHPILL